MREVASWLELLVELGHTPTEVEQQVIERGAALSAGHHVEEDEIDDGVDDNAEDTEDEDDSEAQESSERDAEVVEVVEVAA